MATAPTPAPTPPPGKAISPFRRRLNKIAKNAIAEGVNTVAFILLLAATRWLVEHLFTQSQFFAGSRLAFPVRYLFDLGDIGIIGRFIWNTLKSRD